MDDTAALTLLDSLDATGDAGSLAYFDLDARWWFRASDGGQVHVSVSPEPPGNAADRF